MHLIVPDSLLGVIPSIQALLNFVDARLREDPDAAGRSHPEFEAALRPLAMAVEQSCHVLDLARMDSDAPGIVVDGVRYRRAGQGNLQVATTAGTIVVKDRALFRPRGSSGGRAVGLVELRAGLVDGWITVLAAKQMSEFTAESTPAVASRLLASTGTIHISKSTLDGLTKVVNDAWEPSREVIEELVRLDERKKSERLEDVAAIGMSLDGIMVRMKDAPNTPGTGKNDAGPHGHREAASATVTLYDGDGNRQKTTGFARMPESKKPTLKQQLKAEVAAAIDLYPSATLVALADAAKENSRILGEIAKELGKPFVLATDYCHAASHLSDGLKAGGAPPAEIERWAERLKSEVGGADACLEELAKLLLLPEVEQSPERKKALAEELTYFNNNAATMNYAELRAANLPIASGVQEAACKTYVGHRHKQSGMSWGHRGGQGVLTMRSLVLTGRFDLAWKHFKTRFRREYRIDDDRSPQKPVVRAA